jgi:hypothetical protein
MFTSCPGQRKIAFEEGRGDSKHGFFRAFFGSAWPLKAIRPFFSWLHTNIHEKWHKKSWFWLATHSLLGGKGQNFYLNSKHDFFKNSSLFER